MAKNPQSVARHALTPCAGSDAFRVADGASVRDLNEFRHAIASKSASLVRFHRDHSREWLQRVIDERLGKLRLRAP